MQIFKYFRNWIHEHTNEFDALIFDIDGVLLNRGQRNHGSKELLEILKVKKIPFILLTNDGNHSIKEKENSLKSAGINLSSEIIISCAHAIDLLVLEKKLQKQLFFIMGDLGTPCYAQAAGLSTTRNISDLPKCKGVIVGEDHYDWEPTINAVVNFFIDFPAAILIIPNPDEFYPDQVHSIRLAAGSVGRLVTHALNLYGIPIDPTYLGKPYCPIFQIAHKKIEKKHGYPIPVDRVLMVGDNLHSDIKGANDFGYHSALMLTGVTCQATLTRSPIQPKFVFTQL